MAEGFPLFQLFFPVALGAVVLEKEHRIREIMKLQGLKMSAYFTSVYVFQFGMYLVATLLTLLLGVALGSPQAALSSPDGIDDALTKERILAHIQARLQATEAGDSPVSDVGEAQAMLAVLEKAAGCAEELVAASQVNDCADERRSP